MGVMSILQYSNKKLLSALNQLGNLDRYVKMTPNLTDGKNFNHSETISSKTVAVTITPLEGVKSNSNATGY